MSVYKCIDELVEFGLVERDKSKQKTQYILKFDKVITEKKAGFTRKKKGTNRLSSNLPKDRLADNLGYDVDKGRLPNNLPLGYVVKPTPIINSLTRIQPEYNPKVNGGKKPAVGKQKKSKEKKPTTEVWEAYSREYLTRYSTEPIRNAKVNSQIKQFVDRVPQGTAPAIAAFYVYHENYFYVQKGHCIGLLLTDAEKLHTEWVTNTKITAGTARQRDRTQTNANAFAPLLKAAREKEHGK